MTPIPPKSLVPRFFALIPCAGQGMRAIGDNAAQAAAAALPKQYQPIAGVPMVQHTLQAFAGVARIDSCLVVVAPGDDFNFNALIGPINASTGFRRGYVVTGNTLSLEDGGGIETTSYPR